MSHDTSASATTWVLLSLVTLLTSLLSGLCALVALSALWPGPSVGKVALAAALGALASVMTAEWALRQARHMRP